MLFFLAGAGWFVRHVDAGRRDAAQQATIRKLERQLVEARQEMAALRAEMITLVQGRLPHARLLELDTVISLDQDGLRNIFFTQTDTGKTPTYEFTLVVQNTHSTTLFPRVEVIVFDRTGLQVGTAPALASQNSGPFPAPLEPDEVRTFRGRVTLPEDARAEYFTVCVEPAVP